MKLDKNKGVYKDSHIHLEDSVSDKNKVTGENPEDLYILQASIGHNSWIDICTYPGNKEEAVQDMEKSRKTRHTQRMGTEYRILHYEYKDTIT